MTSKDDIDKFKKTVTDKIPISKKWKDHILEQFKKQAVSIEDISEIRDIILTWTWITRNCEWVWKTVNLLSKYPASTVYLLGVNYVIDEGLDKKDFSKKDERNIRDHVRRAIHKLHYAGLITAVVMDPTEVPVGVRAPTVWISPFAKSDHIQKTKNFYRNMGGWKKKASKKTPKDAKEITEHNLKMKVYSILSKWKYNYQVYDYYKCPKKHDEGYKRKKKKKSKSLARLTKYNCVICKKELEKISFLEFYEYKEKDLLKKWGIK
jgi:hypothetical protein